MNKILEAVKSLLPPEHLKEVARAVNEALQEVRAELEAEFNHKLEEAYAQLSTELAQAEKTAEQGYAEAYGIITELRNRMEQMREEYEAQLEEGYEEAYQMLLGEQEKYQLLEKKLYDEYDGKLLEMKTYIVEKVNQFLEFKGQEIYEQARRDILSDPRYAEHKVILDKIVDAVAGHLDTEDRVLASSSKIEEAYRHIKDLEGQVKLIESRNIRLDMENRTLNEAVSKYKGQLITESRTSDRKERLRTAQNATGRGRIVTEEQVEVIREHNAQLANGRTNDDTTTLHLENANELVVLAGVVKTK